MANIFDQKDPTRTPNDGDSLFSMSEVPTISKSIDFPPPSADLSTANYIDEDLNRMAGLVTGSMLALGKQELMTPDMINGVKADIINRREDSVRFAVADMHRQQRVDNFKQLANEALSLGSKEDAKLYTTQAILAENEYDFGTLEQQGVRGFRLSTLRNPVKEHTVSSARTRLFDDSASKRAMILNRAAKIKAEADLVAEESWTAGVLNTLAKLVPLNEATMIADGVDVLRPGSTLMEQYAELMNTPMPQFEAKLNNYVENLRKNSAVIAGENPSLVADVLSRMANLDDGDVAADNLFAIYDALDIATLGVGTGLGAKAGKLATKGAQKAAQAAAKRSSKGTVNELKGLDKATREATLAKKKQDPTNINLVRQAGDDDLAAEAIVANRITKKPNPLVPSEARATRESLPFRNPHSPTDNLHAKVDKEFAKQEIILSKLGETLGRATGRRITLQEMSDLNVDQINDLIMNNPRAVGLSQTELNDVIQTTLDTFESAYPQAAKPAASYDINPANLEPRVNLDIGRPDGQPFITRELAKQEAVEKYNFKPSEFTIVEDPSGNFLIRKYEAFTPEGLIKGYEIPKYQQSDTLAARAESKLRRWATQPRGSVPEQTQAAGTAAVVTESKAFKLIKDIVDRNINKLGPQDQSRLAALADEVRDIEEWPNLVKVNEIFARKFNRNMTTRELAAWKDYVDLSDMDYTLANIVVRRQLTSEGAQSIDIIGAEDLQKMVGKEVNTFDEMKLKFAYNYSKRQPEVLRSPEDFEALKAAGYRMVRLYDEKYFDGDIYPYILVKADNIEVNPLHDNILPYKAGGRLQYADKSLFIKQRRVVERYVDNQKIKYELNPLTQYVEASASKAKRLVKNWNEAIDEYKRFKKMEADGTPITDKMRKELNVTIAKTNRYQTLDDFESAIARGEVTTEKLAIYANRAKDPMIGDTTPPEATLINMTTTDDGHIQQLFTHQRGKFARRGERKLNADEGPAELKSSFETLQESLGQSVNNFAFAELKITEPLRWVKTYTPYLEADFNASPIEILRNAKFKDNTPISILNSGENYRNYINDLLRVPTKSQLQEDLVMVQRAARIESLTNGTIFEKNIGDMAIKLNKNWRDAKPSEFFRSMNFHLTLGLFNVAQLPLQASAMGIVIGSQLRNPKLMFGAIKDWVVLNRISIRNSFKDAVYINQLVKQTKDADVTDAVSLWRDLNDSGFTIIDKNMTVRDTALTAPELFQPGAMNRTTAALQTVKEGVSKTVDKSMMFFSTGEREFRLSAFAVARRKAIEEGILKNKMTAGERQRALQWVVNEADRLSFGQTRANQMWIQKASNDNILNTIKSLTFQFAQFGFKMTDAMAPRFLGGSKAYTTAEKLSMVGAGLFLFGSSTVPFADEIIKGYYEEYARSGQTDLTFDEFKSRFRGVVDRVVTAATGETTAIGERVTVGGQISDTISNMFNGRYSPAEILTGAFGQRLIRTYEELQVAQEMYDLTHDLSTDTLSKAGLQIAGSVISSVGAYNRYKQQVDTGKIFDRHGRPVSEISSRAALMNLIGIPTNHYQKTYDLGDINRSFSQDDKKILTAVSRLYIEYYRALSEQKYDEARDYMKAIKHSVAPLPLSKRGSMMEAARRQIGNDTAYKRYTQKLLENLKAAKSN